MNKKSVVQDRLVAVGVVDWWIGGACGDIHANNMLLNGEGEQPTALVL